MGKLSNEKKTAQLGMPVGTASNRLRKSIIFKLIKQLGENFCFQCGTEIESEKELSIEHKIPYLDSENPKELFFDLENIAFSHLKCNVGAARETRTQNCGTAGYARGCRCSICVTAQRKSWNKYDKKRRNKESGTARSGRLPVTQYNQEGSNPLGSALGRT